MEKKIPAFVNRDPDLIMSEIKTQMEGMLGRQIQPAHVEQLMLQAICYREVLLLERFNAGMAQMLFQFSQAPVLDYIAGLVAVERLPAANAGCIVRFILVPGHGSVVIPAGTRVATGDGKAIFAVADDIAVPSTVNSVEALVTAQIAGKAANGYEPGFVNKILDPLAFVSSVTNMTATGGGSDEETDEQLRERIKLAPTQYSTAGSRQSYIYHAKSANPAIIDVSVSSPVPGTVYIVPLLAEGTYAQVVADIHAVCSAETVRPLTDMVIVSEPTEINYGIEVELTVYEGANVQDTEDRVLEALKEYTESKSRRLGLDIIRSHITQVCRIPEVYDVRVVLPSWAAGNIIVEYDEVPVCSSIAVTTTGTNYG